MSKQALLIIEKQASDAFYETRLDESLREFGVETVIITGMMTEYCVDATARSALSHDYGTVLVEDGHTTGDAGLDAARIIDHHNELLPNLAHPTRRIKLVKGSAVAFA